MRPEAPDTWRPRTPPPGGRAATPPGPGQESVWDYPRPPAVVPTSAHVRVLLGTTVVAETRRALRVLETSHPPTYHLPLADVAPGALVPAGGESTFCEFNGRVVYFDLVGTDENGRRVLQPRAARTYPAPAPGHDSLAGHVAPCPLRNDLATHPCVRSPAELIVFVEALRRRSRAPPHGTDRQG